MAKPPHVFENKKELENTLASSVVTEEMKKYFSRRRDSIYQVVRESVGSNVFRAFHYRRYGLRPSDMYRRFVVMYFEEHLDRIRTISTHEELRSFLFTAACALMEWWNAQVPADVALRFGPATKMLNLSLRELLLLSSLTDEQRQRLLSLLDVPLDLYTLQGVRLLLPQLQIPKNATMGFVRDEAHYVLIQDSIRALCEPGCPAARYDFAAWHLAHPGILRDRCQERCGCAA